jgi:hypothetical protein
MSKTWSLDEALRAERRETNEFLGLDGTAILDANAQRHAAVALADIARTLRAIYESTCLMPTIARAPELDLSGLDAQGQKAVAEAVQQAVSEVNEALGHADTRA